MIITVTLNPALDKTVTLPGFAINTVNRVQSVRLDPGGKGINVSKTIQALGGSTLVLGVLGGAAGGYIKTALDAMNLANDMVLTPEPTRTNIKIVDPILQTSTDINEPGGPLSPESLHAVWDKLIHAVKPGDTVVFAGKNPPGVADSQLADWIRRLHALDVQICVDTVGEPMRQAIAEHPAIIKPNRSELEELMGTPLPTDAAVLDAARSLVSQGVGLVTVSLGGDGALFVTRDTVIRGYSPKIPVISTVGAGDSMMAALAYYRSAGCALEETARRSLAVASAAVTCSGSQPPSLDRILPLIDRIQLQYL